MQQTKQTKQRTCIACRTAGQKGGLLRVVKTPEGTVEFDPSGRKNGRGAYVCSVACYDKACKSGALSRALRIKLSQDDYERIGNDLLASVLSDAE